MNAFSLFAATLLLAEASFAQEIEKKPVAGRTWVCSYQVPGKNTTFRSSHRATEADARQGVIDDCVANTRHLSANQAIAGKKKPSEKDVRKAESQGEREARELCETAISRGPVRCLEHRES